MKIVVSRVESREDLNNGRYNFYVDKDNLVEFSKNIHEQTKDKIATISYDSVNTNKITIEKILERVK